MKLSSKTVLLSVLVALSAAELSAQISLGIRGGLNLSKWSLNDEAKKEIEGFDLENINALLLGALVEIRLSNNLAIQPEVNFIQKGSRLVAVETAPVPIKVEGTTTLNYVEVPLLLKVGTGFGVGRFDVLLGPSFGYALSGKRKFKATVAGQTETETENVDFDEDDIARTDVGAQVGASLGLGLGSSARLFVDGRYLLGFSNLDQHEHTGGGDEPTIRNRGIALTAGIIFSF